MGEFEKIGGVIIKKTLKTGEGIASPYLIIQYDDPRDAFKAKQLNGHHLEGYAIKVDFKENKSSFAHKNIQLMKKIHKAVEHGSSLIEPFSSGCRDFGEFERVNKADWELKKKNDEDRR